MVEGDDFGRELRHTAGLRHRRITVLVVDDDFPVLGAITRMFKDHDVRAATNYNEAEQVMVEKGVHLDAVVSDFRMPGPNGLDVLACALRAQPGAVRVLLTASPPANVQELLATGEVHACIEKPFNASLARKVEGLVDGRKAGRLVR